ncbi:MAG: PAS domain S-box protein [Marinospirillum sp.]|uniref:PAS domain-containing protein n=1 Tax=Marinospirillum sp. TaxID=2183934 RepID=UPI0019EECA6F|nr:PAS domain-containing protein [Marinospirillum sp.]MBE0506883.1 PAS domain S-box protein [Marinospirillum sp.]
MSVSADESNILTELRNKAEQQLQTGTTRAGQQWSLGVDALQMLYRMSSDPGRAEDALKLLHELQVHQVELDLQNEEMATNERDLAEDLSLYRELYDSAPISYFVVDLTGKVIQGNVAAAELLGLGFNELPGQDFGTFLIPQNRPLLLDLLKRVAQSGNKDFCIVEQAKDKKGSRGLRLMASTCSRHEHLLLACCEC